MTETLASAKLHGGQHRVLKHHSPALGGTAEFAIFVPPGEGPFPVLLYLSGLTCTWENAATKAGAQAYAAREGVCLVFPDTSPRGTHAPDDDAYDLGQGAGFYLDATQSPWSTHFRMRSYVLEDLLPAAAEQAPLDTRRLGITGHSMGGHGALTLALTAPERFASVSAFSPICAPSEAPWGQRAFAAYFGDDRAAWQAHDASLLLRARGCALPLLVDFGADDPFLEDQLMPARLQEAAAESGAQLALTIHPGYDHSYWFVASRIAAHIRHHAKALRTP